VPVFATGAAVVTWTKLGDEFSDEARDLTDAEYRTHSEALIWSNRRGLDLVIPKRDLKKFAESPDAETATEGLIAKDWWADEGDAWNVGLRFPEWQLESVVIRQRKEANALRVRRSRMHKAGDHSICMAGNCAAVTPDVMHYDMRDETHYETHYPGRVGSGYRPPDPSVQNQDQPQGQEQPLTNSQNRRVRQGPGTVADDDQQFPRHPSESPAAGGNARARPGASPVDKLAS
jgi:hypothetical protein